MTFKRLAVVLVAGVAGCASPPNGDIRLAESNFDKAIAVGAAEFAPDALSLFRRRQTELKGELQTQQSRWFKSYARATELAVLMQEAADTAAAQAESGKAQAIAEATAGSAQFLSGPGLFVNGDFTAALTGWTAHPDSVATRTVERDGDRPVCHIVYRTGNWSVMSQVVPLRPDSLYAYEATLRTTAPVVALYWQSDIGRYFEVDKTYPEWTTLRYVFATPHWQGEAYPAQFHPVLMKGPGEVWFKQLRLVRLTRVN